VPGGKNSNQYVTDNKRCPAGYRRVFYRVSYVALAMYPMPEENNSALKFSGYPYGAPPVT
jgi:hypothetical protein